MRGGMFQVLKKLAIFDCLYQIPSQAESHVRTQSAFRQNHQIGNPHLVGLCVRRIAVRDHIDTGGGSRCPGRKIGCC